MGWKTNLLTLQPFMQKTMQKTVSREGHGEWHPLTHPCTMSQSDSINTAMLLIQEKTKIFDWNKREKKKNEMNYVLLIMSTWLLWVQKLQTWSRFLIFLVVA